MGAGCSRGIPYVANDPPRHVWPEIRASKASLRRMPTMTMEVEGHQLTARQTIVDVAFGDHGKDADTTVKALMEFHEAVMRDKYQLELAGCVFVGHTNTDMDSIGSALGAAELFGGVAARASDINTETTWALAHFDLPMPPPFLDVHKENQSVCLVDHCQISQTTRGVKLADIRGIIDHHALQANTVVTDLPIYVDIRPWGSACTIIAHTSLLLKHAFSPKIAGLLLCGILSDTLNLRSPTTTIYDMKLVPILAKLANVDDVNGLAGNLFKAKSQAQVLMSAHDLVRGDTKTFEFESHGKKVAVAFGVIETTDLQGLMDRSSDLMTELRALKHEEEVDVAFLALCDIVELHGQLLICGPREQSLATEAFKGSMQGEHLMDLGDRVSRKKNFIPPLSVAFKEGFKLPDVKEINEDFGPVYMECSDMGCRLVRAPSSAANLTRFGKSHPERYAPSGNGHGPKAPGQKGPHAKGHPHPHPHGAHAHPHGTTPPPASDGDHKRPKKTSQKSDVSGKENAPPRTTRKKSSTKGSDGAAPGKRRRASHGDNATNS